MTDVDDHDRGEEQPPTFLTTMAAHSKSPAQRLFSQFLLLWLISAVGIWRNNLSMMHSNPANVDNATRMKAATTTMTQRLKSPNIKTTPSKTNKVTRNKTTDAMDAALLKSVVNKTGLPKDLLGVRRIFTGGRHDRSGAAVMHALKGHAYARKWGLEYGGVCYDTPRTPVHESMIQSLGLLHEIPFHACPTRGDPSQIQISGAEFLPRLQENFSKEWCNYMQSQIRRATHNTTVNYRDDSSKQQSPLQVAVHVRRGDVSLCSVHYDRFLPNQHYLQVIEKYILDPSMTTTTTKRPVNITIFSESSDTLYEPLEDLVIVGGEKKSYTTTTHLVLDSPIEEVWRQMMDSDVLILSKSSFGFVPALLSTRLSRIIFTPWGKFSPNKQYPMDDWEVVDSAIVDLSTVKVKEMRERFCPKKPLDTRRPG